MALTTALSWIDGMNTTAYLGQTNWELPSDPSGCGGFGCTGSPMGELYYTQLELSQGTPVVPTPDIDVGPFYNVQHYLYWSCAGPYTSPPCQNPPPSPNFEWSFSFGNGFQGTDLEENDLYGMVYYPDPQAQAGVNISITPVSLNFGDVYVGKSASQTITITNQTSSTAALTGSVGTLMASFSVISGGGAFSLSPGQSLVVTVQFSPTTAGIASATLFITHNAANESSPVMVALSGTGINANAPVILVTPMSTDYGNLKVKRSKSASFKLTNSGKSNLTVISTTITGTDASMFTISGGGGKTIKPGKSLTIKVVFKPTSTGSKSANLVITSNDPVNPSINIPLSGTGQ